MKVKSSKLKVKSPEVRYLYDTKKVLYDQKWLKGASNFPVYYMYRGIKRKKGLRYDITIIPPKMLGKEFTKTKGHEHSGKFGEIYIVLEGQALYLMQKWAEGKVKDVYAVKAKNNDVVIIPPNYGHVTINPSKKDLKMANWISENCKSNYQLFEKMGGACYYYTRKEWVKNKNYKKIPKLRFEKPLKTMLKNLDFLKG